MIAKSLIPTAAYYRMSDDRQETSIPAQKDAVEKFARDRGYSIVQTYADEGISGWKSDERKAFQKMIDDAEKGKFKAIVCWSQDRFSRFDPMEFNFYAFRLRRAGVQIVTVSEGPLSFDDLAGWLVASVNQHAKEQYVRDLAKNTLRGKLRGARAGEWVVAPPLGYQRDGRKLILGESREVEIIRRIFQMYVGGYSLRGVADVLNSEGQRSRTGKHWKADIIRKIILNPVYTGDVVWNRNSCGKFNRVSGDAIAPKGDGGYRNDPEDWIVSRDMHEPIVSRETFKEAGETLAKNFKHRTPHRNGGLFVLTQFLYCGHCGYKMHGRVLEGTPYYTCGGYNQRGRSVCQCYNVQQNVLVDLLLEHVEKFLLAPANVEKLKAALRRGVKEFQKGADVPAMKRELTSLDRKLEKYTKRMLECDTDMLPQVQTAIRELRAEQERLRVDLRAAETPQKQLRDRQDTAVEQAIAKLTVLRSAIRDADPIRAREFFTHLFNRVDLHFERQEGKKRAKNTLHRLSVSINPEAFVSTEMSPGSRVRSPPSEP